VRAQPPPPLFGATVTNIVTVVVIVVVTVVVIVVVTVDVIIVGIDCGDDCGNVTREAATSRKRCSELQSTVVCGV
jgi:hypothetical protein